MNYELRITNLKLRTAALLLLVTCHLSLATQVMLPLQSFFNGANYSRPVQIIAVHQWLTDYTNLFLGSFTMVTPTGGTNPIVKLQPNDYLLTAPDVRGPLRFTVYATNGVVNILSLLPTNSPVLAYFPVIPLGGVAGGFNGVITNLNFYGNVVTTNTVQALFASGAGTAGVNGLWYQNGSLASFTNTAGYTIVQNYNPYPPIGQWVITISGGTYSTTLSNPIGSPTNTWVNTTGTAVAPPPTMVWTNLVVSYTTNLVLRYNFTTYTNGVCVTNILQ